MLIHRVVKSQQYMQNGAVKKKPQLVVVADYSRHTPAQLSQFVENLSDRYTVTVLDTLDITAPLHKNKLDILSLYIADCISMRVDGQFHLIGLYTGSVVAEHFARIYPERVLSVTSIGRKSAIARPLLPIGNLVKQIFKSTPTPVAPLFRPALG